MTVLLCIFFCIAGALCSYLYQRATKPKAGYLEIIPEKDQWKAHVHIDIESVENSKVIQLDVVKLDYRRAQ
jgi:hypothetical protein